MDTKEQEFVNWDQMWSQFRKNVQPAKVANLAKAWGITIEAINWLGIGWDASKMCWVFREFDHAGKIVGLACRAAESDGTPKKKKFAVVGSVRGLTYAPDPEHGGIPAYIDHPIPIPEGASDVLASLSIGMYAIGRPSATGSAESNAWLQKAVKGRDIAICMEYDKGAGMVSALDHAKRLFKHCKSIRFLEPPEGVKDIRGWISSDWAVTEIQFQFERAPFEADALAQVAGDVLTSVEPMDVAKSFVIETFNRAGHFTLRRWMDRWMRWDGHAYEHASEETVRAKLYRYLDEKRVLVPPKSTDQDTPWVEKPFAPNKAKVTNVLDAAKAVMGVELGGNVRMPKWLDVGDDLPNIEKMVVFRNGILDVEEYAKTGVPRFMKKTPLLFAANYCDYNFRPEALVDVKPYTDWLYDVTGSCPITVELVRRWGGYCMTNDNSAEKFMFMYGRPSSGKGTLMDVLERVIGSRNIYSMRLESLGDGFSLYSTLGKTNIFMPDTQSKNFERASTALEIIKTITGNGAIDVAGKNIQAATYKLNTRFTIAANEIPNFHDSASALRRRLLITWMPKSFEGNLNPEIKKGLVQPKVIEAAAVWHIQGYINYLREGFPTPPSSARIMDDFEEANNPLAAYFKQTCTLEQNYEIPKNSVYESYESWCRSNGVRPMKMTAFKAKFPMLDPRITPGKSSPSQFEQGKRTQIYNGVRLKGPLDD